MIKSKVFVVFESPEDTNLPSPLIAFTQKFEADYAIEVFKEKEPCTRYWVEELDLIESILDH